jgi:Flp pilus assembly pilin Flp
MTPDHNRGLKHLLRSFQRNEKAATSVEYALIGVVMAIMLFAAVPPLRDQLVNIFTYLSAAFQTANS